LYPLTLSGPAGRAKDRQKANPMKPQTLADKLAAQIAESDQAALTKYNKNYNNTHYLAATRNDYCQDWNKTASDWSPDTAAQFENFLIDQALALCGHSAYSVSQFLFQTSCVVPESVFIFLADFVQ
jgi:hypothetical protein